MYADMDKKEESTKSDLKEQSPAMKLTEQSSAMKLTGARLESESRSHTPTVVNEHHDSGHSVKHPTGLKSSVTKLTNILLFAKVFSKSKWWQRKAGKIFLVAFIFVFLQGLLLAQLQNAALYHILGTLGMGGIASPEECEANFQEALFIDPKNPAAAGWIAQAAFSHGDFEKAIKYANLSVHLNPTIEGYNVLTASYLAQNKLKEAEKPLEATLREFPNEHLAFARAELNWVQKKLGKNVDSHALYEKALADTMFPQVALDFHHMGYDSREGVYGFPKNAYLTLAFEDIAIDLHVEKIDPLRLLYAHTNKASAYNELYQPEKAIAEFRMVLPQMKEKSDQTSVYTNLKVSDRLMGDYASLVKDSKAEARINGWPENNYDLAEASFFAKNYKAAIKYADANLSDKSDDEEQPWTVLFGDLSRAALHQRVDLSMSKIAFQKYLETEIATLRKHNLNKRADDLQWVLHSLDKAN
jgi:tetratricopeptide (TPR) repeat protein